MRKLPSTRTMYKALLQRDSSFEGVFYVGVRTTGVFCRPTCAARKPKPENVEYFSSSKEALFGGYRPCTRCHPLDGERKPSAVVMRLREAVERSGKLSGRDLRAMGIDPSTARRQFQRFYRMTFQEYQRARRMGLALHSVRNGESVIEAQLANGYESSSGFWGAFTNLFGTPPSRAEEVNCLQAQWIETPLGPMLALANDEGLHMLEFVDRRGLEHEITTLRRALGCVIVPGNNPHLEKIKQELRAYFDGIGSSFSTPIVVEGSLFERRVWNELLKIPVGSTQSYGDIARRIGDPKAIRAVGRANGRNSLAIVIPCHRVIRADGSLSGYGGGVWRKRWLLDHEKGLTRRD
ncbi:MAG: bifunctional transcriptional activator/DNA repair protein Ada [Ignavibacteriae bacterium]|nr:bifunctional transcriptional activator/DNA repair protein Ada [Ignavibacteriota bacterium]